MPHPTTLTDTQRETVVALWAFTIDQGYHPSLRELGEILGLRSASSVHARLESLEQAGVIRRRPRQPRAIELVIPRQRPEPGQYAGIHEADHREDPR